MIRSVVPKFTYLPCFLVCLLACCLFFLFPFGLKFFSSFILIISLLIIGQKYLSNNLIIDTACVKRTLLPWLPLAMALIVLVLFHGISGYSFYFEGIALVGLTTLAIGQFRISEKFIVFLLMFLLFVCCSAIISYVFIYGLSGEIFGVNKNKLLCGLSLIMASTIGALAQSYSTYSKSEAIALGIGFVVFLITVAVTEVRTAVLSLIAVIIVILGSKKFSYKTVLSLLIPLILLVIALLLSDRLQQGFRDLQMWNEGNPNSSWGIRLELWRLAFGGFLEKPSIGWGPRPFNELLDAGFIWRIPSFSADHFHSDFFNHLVSNGFIGILGWFVTLFMLIKSSRNNFSHLCLIFSSFMMGLSERVWFDNKATFFIFICLWVLFSVTTKSSQQIRSQVHT